MGCFANAVLVALRLAALAVDVERVDPPNPLLRLDELVALEVEVVLGLAFEKLFQAGAL